MITILGTDETLHDYQVKIELDSSNFDFDSASDDGSDIHFVDNNDDELPYWIESWDDDHAVIWCKVPVIPAGSSVYIWMIYGDSGPHPSSNGDLTFEFFDDFIGVSSYIGSWTTKTSMNHAVADVPCVVYNNKLYCFGGYGDGSDDAKNYTQEYDPITDSWTDKTPMPTARWGPAAALYNGKAYVFGGAIDSVMTGSNKCECYDISNDTWSTKANLPSEIAKQGLMAVTVGSKIYLFYRQYTYEYDPETDTYTQKLSTNPIDRTWATCAYVNIGGEDRIYLIGGYDYEISGGTNKNYYYKPSTNSWSSEQTPAPYAAWGTIRESCVYNGEIYYGFGQHPSGTYYTHLYRYNPVNDAWSLALAEASYARDGVGAGIINGKLYVVGGRADHTGFDYNEKFDPATNSQYVLDSDKWDVILNNGSYSISNDGILTLSANAGNSNYQIGSKAFFTPKIALRMKSKLEVTEAIYQIIQAGWCVTDASPENVNDLHSHHGTHYAECGDGTDYSLNDIGATHFGDWYTYDIIRLGTSTKFYKNGELINDCSYDLNGARHLHLLVRDSEKRLYCDWILVRKYADPEPTVII